MAVLIEGDEIKQLGTLTELSGSCANQINLGDAIILPGFIESYAHTTFQNMDKTRSWSMALQPFRIPVGL